jgi:hypothetical protein
MTRGRSQGRALAVASHHLRAGTRAALRASAVGVGAVIFAVGSAPEPASTLRSIVLGAVGTRSSPASRVMLAAFALLLAGAAARRITLGIVTWMRSLPVSALESRRGAWLAATAATLPVALFAVAACALASTLYDAALSPARLVTLPALLLAAGAAALPVERRPARAAALLALVMFAWGTWTGVLAGALALAAWDRRAGGLVPTPLVRHSPRHATRSAARGLRPRLRAGALVVRWSWRVLGPRAAAQPLLLAALPVAFASFVRANNPELSDAARSLAVRVGAGVGIALAAAAIAGPLLARRPPWPWLRTLPWTCTRRVLVDAAAVALPLLGVGARAMRGPAARGERLGPSEPIAVLATVACAAASVSAALRAGAHRQTGAVGESLLVSLVAAVAFALVPSLAWSAPAAAAALVLLGARRERGGIDAARWNELRHGVAGDVGWVARA